MNGIIRRIKCLWYHWVKNRPYYSCATVWIDGYRLLNCYQCPHCGREWDTYERV